MTQTVQIIDANGNTFEGDPATHAMIGVTYAHHEIHDGNSFVVSEQVQLADAGTREYRIATPNTTRWAHMIVVIDGSLDTTVEIYETTTKTAGTAMTARNRNRNSANAATTTITHTPGGAGDGTLIWTTRFGNDSGPAGKGGTGGGSRGVDEWVLKQNTAYLIRITSNSADNNVATQFDWYELTSKG